MNRIILIGNGFDLAHGLKTKYEDFIGWYWEQWGERLRVGRNMIESDELCSFTLNRSVGLSSWYLVWGHYYKRNNPLEEWDPNVVVNYAKNRKDLCKFEYTSLFFERINKSIETKGWVDIENEYYKLLAQYALKEVNGENKVEELNAQLYFLQIKLVEYLGEMSIKENIIRAEIRSKIYAPFSYLDIAIGEQKALEEHVKSEWQLCEREIDIKLRSYGCCYSSSFVKNYKEKHSSDEKIDWDCVPKDILLPNQILLLNFNYTRTAQLYCKEASIFNINQIHGKIEDLASVIFGYGDELDEDYKKLMDKNENRCLNNIKSIKYLESSNYRAMLSFIESEPYQILIMGHSCGISDRTLLNTLFEHKNCVSIKPYYYKDKETGKDNYLELVQNISRNFKDMKLMRDRVVNKSFTETLTN